MPETLTTSQAASLLDMRPDNFIRYAQRKGLSRTGPRGDKRWDTLAVVSIALVRPKASRRRQKPPSPGFSDICIGSELTSEETLFAQALDRFKREKLRPFPTCSEILGVLLQLGYRKQPLENPQF